MEVCWQSAVSLRGPDLVLRGGTDNDVTHLDTVRLLDGEGDGSGHRVRRDRDLVPLFKGLGLQFRDRHGFCEVSMDEAGRDDGHAQAVAGLLAQALGDGAYGVL